MGLLIMMKDDSLLGMLKAWKSKKIYRSFTLGEITLRTPLASKFWAKSQQILTWLSPESILEYFSHGMRSKLSTNLS
jgi:hypothetical protein